MQVTQLFNCIAQITLDRISDIKLDPVIFAIQHLFDGVTKNLWHRLFYADFLASRAATRFCSSLSSTSWSVIAPPDTEVR